MLNVCGGNVSERGLQTGKRILFSRRRGLDKQTTPNMGDDLFGSIFNSEHSNGEKWRSSNLRREIQIVIANHKAVGSQTAIHTASAHYIMHMCAERSAADNVRAINRIMNPWISECIHVVLKLR